MYIIGAFLIASVHLGNGPCHTTACHHTFLLIGSGKGLSGTALVLLNYILEIWTCLGIMTGKVNGDSFRTTNNEGIKAVFL